MSSRPRRRREVSSLVEARSVVVAASARLFVMHVCNARLQGTVASSFRLDSRSDKAYGGHTFTPAPHLAAPCIQGDRVMLSVPEWVAYREVREVVVGHLAGGDLATGSPKRFELELLERRLA